jgi:hypothetical protein
MGDARWTRANGRSATIATLEPSALGWVHLETVLLHRT